MLKHNRTWLGARATCHPIWITDIAYEYFEVEDHEEYELMVPFTKDSWHGRMKACRGIGASLSAEELIKWDAEHRRLLNEIAPEQFDILHYAAIAALGKKEPRTRS